MNNELRDQRHLSKYELIPITGAHCELDAGGHCITCSEEALHARVLRVDQEAGLAVVTIKDTSEEIDITLVESVAPGDVLLVHGGVAIARLDEVSNA
jgi:hydrogenase maturation factor